MFNLEVFLEKLEDQIEHLNNFNNKFTIYYINSSEKDTK
jgi:hypothetical protein